MLARCRDDQIRLGKRMTRLAALLDQQPPRGYSFKKKPSTFV